MEEEKVARIEVKPSQEVQRQVVTAILDATVKHTGLPSDEEKLDHYLKFVQLHFAEEKTELIRAYHLDQRPAVSHWQSTFHQLVQGLPWAVEETKRRASNGPIPAGEAPNEGDQDMREEANEEEVVHKISDAELRDQVRRMETERIVATLGSIQEHEATMVGAIQLLEAARDRNVHLAPHF